MVIESGTIISLISRTLKNKYPDFRVSKDKTIQGLKKPCFFIFQINSEQNKESSIIFRRDCLINIRFHSDSGRVELDQVGFDLMGLFEELELEGKILRPYRINYEIQEDVLHFFIGFKLRLYKENTKGSMMNDVDLKGGIK